MIKIERAAVDLYGGSSKLDADIFTFKKALKDHAKTIGQASPTAHPFVERIVRESGGKYEVIEPVIPVVEPEPTKSIDELQAEAFDELKALRVKASNQGVRLHNVLFSSKSESLTALIAAKMEADQSPGWQTRWRVGPGQYVLVRIAEVEFLIAAIRALHAKTFAREMELSDQLLSANTPEAFAKIDLTKGWDF